MIMITICNDGISKESQLFIPYSDTSCQLNSVIVAIGKYWKRFKFNLRRRLVDILINDEEQLVAFGFGVGTFIALLPTPGFSIFIGLGAAAFMKAACRPGILLAMVIWNIWTLIPIYAASAWIGEFIFTTDPPVYFHAEFLNQVVHFTRRLLVGNLIISIPLSFACYHLALQLIRKLKSRKGPETILRKVSRATLPRSRFNRQAN